MAIAPVSGQVGGALGSNAASVSYTFPLSVSVGSLITVTAGATPYRPFVLGDCTKTGGTATISAFTLDKVQDGGGVVGGTGQWSAIVTGAGTLTITVTTAASNFQFIACNEHTGSWDSTRVLATNGANFSASGSPSSGNATSVAAALFVGALAVQNNAIVTLTPGGGFTNVYSAVNGTTDIVCARSELLVTIPTTTAASWTVSPAPGTCQASVVVYKEAAAAPATTPGTLGMWDTSLRILSWF